MFRDERVHLFKAHRVGIDIRVNVADQFICALTGMAVLAVDQRVGEVSDMAGGDPGLRIHDDCGIQADVEAAFPGQIFSAKPF